jgi:uncharacterized membrane protein YfcA
MLLGYFGALIMGISLGLIGGGGSILSVPILIYLFDVNVELATAYSLFIVGISSLAGAAGHFKLNNIHWKTAFIFGIPSILGVYATRAYLLPLIPNELFTYNDFTLQKSLFLLLLFAVIMLLASVSMIRNRTKCLDEKDIKYNYPLIFLEGIIVGIITGLVGAGGGFLIIPALVLLAKLPMKKAIGTSLIIIAVKSLTGFIGDIKNSMAIDWTFLSIFTLIAIAGIIIGSLLSKNIQGEKLKPAFGWFILVMGCWIIVNELIIKN